MNEQKNKSKGFITVATKRKQYLIGADYLKESILDHYEDAKITLFTEQKFIDDPECQSYFKHYDKVIATPDSTNREKMWGMANTPYDQTLYLDADIEIVHDDIQHVFDRLEDNDMVWVELKEETKGHFMEWDWGDGPIDHLTHCGGVCLYNSENKLTREFMMDWYNIHFKMRKGIDNPPELDLVPKSFLQWDQTTLWWLLWHCDKYKELKWKYFDDNYRWNYYSSFGFNKDGTHNYGVVDPVIIHYSSWMDKHGDKGFL